MSDLKLFVNSWIEYVFGPLYYISFNIKFHQYGINDMYSLIVENPLKFFEILTKILGSESLAEAFIATLISYAKNLGLNQTPTREELISWFKDNNVNSIRMFINSVISRA